MQIEVKIDAACRETKVTVVTAQINDEVNALLNRLKEEAPQVIAGFRGGTVTILEQPDIIRIYTVNGKVMASAVSGEYSLRMRLYELEERLAKDRFVRISNAEIINLRKVRGFDLNFAGTICVTLCDGAVTYVSRRYVARIKQVLGI